MALSVGTTSRDAVANALYELAYDDLTTRQQGNINTALADALEEIEMVASCFGLASGSAPDEWASWFHRLGASYASTSGSPEMAARHQQHAERAMEMCLAAYSSDANADANTYGSFTLAQIRKDVRSRLAHLRIFVSVNVVDQHFEDVLSELWHLAPWSFRRLPVTLTIAANGTVTAADSADAAVDYSRIDSYRLYYGDTQKGSISWADTDTMAAMKALASDAGRPEFFRVHRDGDDVVWTFYPAPDQEYTVRAEVSIDGPPAITASGSSSDLAGIPRAIRPILVEWLTLRIRVSSGDRQASATLNTMIERVHARLREVDDIGKPVEQRLAPRNVRDIGLDGDDPYIFGDTYTLGG